MQISTMHKLIRSLLPALLLGWWLFANSIGSPELIGEWAREIAQSARFAAIAEPTLDAYHALLDRSTRVQTFDEFASTRDGRIALGGLALVLLGLFVGLRRMRAIGHLNLHLLFANEIEGEFEIQLFRKSQRQSRSKSSGGSAIHTRSSVQRETQFDRIAAGIWFLSIEGKLRAPESAATLASVSDELKITITPNQCKSIEHTLPSVEAPVEFLVHWDRRPAGDIGLSLRGQPESVRHSTLGRSQMTLPLGDHVMLIGSGDRIVEKTISIRDFEPRVIEVDLATPECLVFKGCPPAVEPFLHGDFNDAAKALERDGQTSAASLLRARLHQEQGQTERAAEQLENAGRVREAAELRRSISDFDRAARLFEDAGDLRPRRRALLTTHGAVAPLALNGVVGSQHAASQSARDSPSSMALFTYSLMVAQ